MNASRRGHRIKRQSAQHDEALAVNQLLPDLIGEARNRRRGEIADRAGLKLAKIIANALDNGGCHRFQRGDLVLLD